MNLKNSHLEDPNTQTSMNVFEDESWTRTLARIRGYSLLCHLNRKKLETYDIPSNMVRVSYVMAHSRDG